MFDTHVGAGSASTRGVLGQTRLDGSPSWSVIVAEGSTHQMHMALGYNRQLPNSPRDSGIERLLMEEIDYSMLYRWFVGMNLGEPVWDVTVFTKNRNRLLGGGETRKFLAEVVRQAQAQGLTSDERFTADGTLIPELRRW